MIIRDSLLERRDANLLTVTDTLMDSSSRDRDKNNHRVAEARINSSVNSRTHKASKVLEVFLHELERYPLLSTMS